MGFWKSVARKIGASDAGFWRQPGFFRFRLARDIGPRLLYGLGWGTGIASPVVALLLLSAPAGEFPLAILLSLAMIVCLTLVVFVWHDLVEVAVALEETAIRRTTKPLLMNILGSRNQAEQWKYSAVKSCGIVAGTDLGTRYSVLVLAIPGRMVAIGIPPQVDTQQVARELTEHGLSPKRLKTIPAEAIPGCSVNRKGMTRALVAAGVGLALALAGLGGRVLVGGGGARGLDMLAINNSMANVPEGKTIRSFTGVGAGGLTGCQLSPDGHWVWGVDKATQKNLLWRDTQDGPVGELTIPPATRAFAEFTRDGQRVVVCADRDAYVWQLDPLESVRQFSLKENPDAITLSLDGRELVVVTMTSVRTYSVESGQPVVEHVNLPPNAVLGAAMTEDGGSVRVICQPRILDIQLKNGTVTELVAFTKPQGVYFYGSLSHGAKFAVAQGNAGIERFDLDRTTQSRLVAGLGFVRPVVTWDGDLVAAPYLNGNGVWDTSTGKPLVKYTDAPPAQLTLSADDRRLLGWSLSTANLKLWEMTTR